jgi:hypothetical protein
MIALFRVALDKVKTKATRWLPACSVGVKQVNIPALY